MPRRGPGQIGRALISGPCFNTMKIYVVSKATGGSFDLTLIIPKNADEEDDDTDTSLDVNLKWNETFESILNKFKAHPKLEADEIFFENGTLGALPYQVAAVTITRQYNIGIVENNLTGPYAPYPFIDFCGC